MREFLDEADTLHISHLPEAIALQKRASVAGKWASRANNALRRRSYLNTLEALENEAGALTITAPQVRDTVEIRPRYGRDTAEMRSRCDRSSSTH